MKNIKKQQKNKQKLRNTHLTSKNNKKQQKTTKNSKRLQKTTKTIERF